MRKSPTLLLCAWAALLGMPARASNPLPSFRVDETNVGHYFARARREGVTGTVTVVFRIDENGKAYDAQVESSDAEALNFGALALIKSATFVVAPRDSADTKRRYTFAIFFALTDPDEQCHAWEAPAWADYSKAICALKGSLSHE
jgi:TonB family protein